jgi:5S rRNA maturation endonuclease (ribonuclease M5)
MIEEGGVSFKEGASSFIFTCPRCNKPEKLYVRKTDGRFVCFVCQEESRFAGKAEFGLSEIYGITISEARERIYNYSTFKAKELLTLQLNDPYELNYDVEESFGLDEVEYPIDFVDRYSKLFPKAREYLLGRGLNNEIIEYYDIRFHPSWKTVIFPIKIDSILVGWQERAIDRNFKFTSKGFKKAQCLMFQDNLSNSDHAILCEGPVDALKMHYMGGAVASMGKGVSETQINIIKDSVKKLYIALDPDANTEIDSLCRTMYDDMDEIYIIEPPKGRKDLGECSFEETEQQFKNAKPYNGQVFMHLKQLRKLYGPNGE